MTGTRSTSMNITFERNALYEEVWSNPLTSLAKKYGLSDNGVRKVCKALNIPLPVAGHWAKVAAGKNVQRIPLPAESERTTFVSHPPESNDATAEDIADAAWFELRKAFERAPENIIVVEQNVVDWHRLIRATRSELVRQAMRVEKWQATRAAREANTKGKPRSATGPGDYAWQQFEESGQLLPLGPDHLPIRVSIGCWERAVRIMHTLLIAANERGIQTKHAENRHALEFQVDGVIVEVKLSEKLEVTKRRISNGSPLDDLLPARYYKIPTGTLRLSVGVGYAVSMIEDSVERPLERRLNALMIRLYRKRNAARRSEREDIAREKLWAEERRLSRERELERQERERLKKVEADRQDALFAEARAWNEACLIRAYLDHIESTLVTKLVGTGSSFGLWLEWARGVANDLDPLRKRLQGRTDHN